jgi:hypothetical protein
MNRFLLLLALLPQTAAIAQDNTPPEHDVFLLDNSYYAEGHSVHDQSRVWYVRLAEGEYQIFAVASAVDRGIGSSLTVSVSAAEGFGFTPVVRSAALNSTAPQQLTFDRILAPREAFYKVEVKASAAFLLYAGVITSRGEGGKIRTSRQKTSPAARLTYYPEDGGRCEYDWLYGEMFVPEGYDPAYTTYTCAGFHGGDFGLRINSDAERSVFFFRSGQARRILRPRGRSGDADGQGRRYIAAAG